MNVHAKIRALVALCLVAITASAGCKPSRDDTDKREAAKIAIQVAREFGPAPVTVLPRAHSDGKFGANADNGWTYNPTTDRVTPRSGKLVLGATGDNPAGWLIDTTTGAFTAPTGKVIAGVDYKPAPNAVGTANLATLSGLAQTVDSVALSSANMKVWLFGQTTVTQDGCWVTAAGAWTRCVEQAAGTSAEGSYFAVKAGTSNKGVWIVHASGAQVVGTDDLTAVNLTSGAGGSPFPLTGDVSAATHRINNAGDPAAAQDLATRNYIDFISAALFWGDGSDGDLSCTSTVTLTRDVQYNNATIGVGCRLQTAGFTVRVANTLDLIAAPADGITRNGAAGGNGAATTTGGTAGAGAGPLTSGHSCGAGTPGTVGGASSPTTGSAATASIISAFLVGGDSGISGAGGGGTGGTAGGTRAGSVGTQRLKDVSPIPSLSWAFISSTGSPLLLSASNGGPGGGGGGGDGTTAGGGGGGGGGGAGGLVIYARIVNRGAGTAVGAISAIGGAGGNGGSPGATNRGAGGGASGGGGGQIHMVVGFFTGIGSTNTLDASGGKGGDGGSTAGSGVGGDGATGGNSGSVALWVLSTGLFSGSSGNTPGSPGTAHSGVTGGVGGAGATARVSL